MQTTTLDKQTDQTLLLELIDRLHERYTELVELSEKFDIDQPENLKNYYKSQGVKESIDLLTTYLVPQEKSAPPDDQNEEKTKDTTNWFDAYLTAE